MIGAAPQHVWAFVLCSYQFVLPLVFLLARTLCIRELAMIWEQILLKCFVRPASLGITDYAHISESVQIRTQTDTVNSDDILVKILHTYAMHVRYGCLWVSPLIVGRTSNLSLVFGVFKVLFGC